MPTRSSAPSATSLTARRTAAVEALLATAADDTEGRMSATGLLAVTAASRGDVVQYLLAHPDQFPPHVQVGRLVLEGLPASAVRGFLADPRFPLRGVGALAEAASGLTATTSRERWDTLVALLLVTEHLGLAQGGACVSHGVAVSHDLLRIERANQGFDTVRDAIERSAEGRAKERPAFGAAADALATLDLAEWHAGVWLARRSLPLLEALAANPAAGPREWRVLAAQAPRPSEYGRAGRLGFSGDIFKALARVPRVYAEAPELRDILEHYGRTTQWSRLGCALQARYAAYAPCADRPAAWRAFMDAANAYPISIASDLEDVLPTVIAEARRTVGAAALDGLMEAILAHCTSGAVRQWAVLTLIPLLGAPVATAGDGHAPDSVAHRPPAPVRPRPR